MTPLLLAFALACAPSTDAPAPPDRSADAPPTEAAPDADERALDAARAAVPALGSTLEGRLEAAMSEGGPDAAVRVCADEAQAITARVADEQGVRVGRSSLRLRNPKNAPPDWVAEWLTAQGERAADGVEGFDRIHGEGDDRVARVLRPIAVKPLCVTCHGPEEQIPASVREVLAEHYPIDAATGYAAGDLRGAVWAETRVR